MQPVWLKHVNSNKSAIFKHYFLKTNNAKYILHPLVVPEIKNISCDPGRSPAKQPERREGRRRRSSWVTRYVLKLWNDTARERRRNVVVNIVSKSDGNVEQIFTYCCLKFVGHIWSDPVWIHIQGIGIVKAATLFL